MCHMNFFIALGGGRWKNAKNHGGHAPHTDKGETTMPQEMYDAALYYWNTGISVLPIRPGTKQPYERDMVRRFSHSHPTTAQLREWFREGDAQIGIVCGPISGDLLVFDFEHRAAAASWLAATGLDTERFPVVHTAHGTHVYVCTGHQLMHQTRATLAALDGVIQVETRGAGGYVLAPPSLHPSGARYELVSGVISRYQIPILDDAEAEQLISQAQQLGTPVAVPVVPTHPATPYATADAWPLGIPKHAQHVRQIGDYWLWEFGGGVLCLGAVGPTGEIGPSIRLGHSLGAFLEDLDQHRERLRQAIAEEQAREAAYQYYVEGLRERWDEDED
ncbi:bifunctional DNA primase/polymerase [Chloroflexia bacterium SDU3-3]|nr:bifunctional DNA primase/polymerase [Chloroflexia bacterium SDU3-3]